MTFDLDDAWVRHRGGCHRGQPPDPGSKWLAIAVLVFAVVWTTGTYVFVVRWVGGGGS